MVTRKGTLRAVEVSGGRERVGNDVDQLLWYQQRQKNNGGIIDDGRVKIR